jgi:hypothetical protein
VPNAARRALHRAGIVPSPSMTFAESAPAYMADYWAAVGRYAATVQEGLESGAITITADSNQGYEERF